MVGKITLEVRNQGAYSISGYGDVNWNGGIAPSNTVRCEQKRYFYVPFCGRRNYNLWKRNWTRLYGINKK